jgi:hypothetical protein
MLAFNDHHAMINSDESGDSRTTNSENSAFDAEAGDCGANAKDRVTKSAPGRKDT